MNRNLLLLLILAGATPADAQLRRRVPRSADPSTWISLSAGLFAANQVSDGKSASTWDFGQSYTPQFHASLERAFQNSASIGVTGTYVNAPFTYVGAGGTNSCTQCDAHMDLVSLGASFHVGGGPGLHQVIEASAGVAQYRNLRRDSDNAQLAPLDGNVDPYFTFGYGFGYTFNSRMQASVVQDIGLVLHERGGLSSQASNTLRQRTIRLNFRYGLGDRSRRR